MPFVNFSPNKVLSVILARHSDVVKAQRLYYAFSVSPMEIAFEMNEDQSIECTKYTFL